MKGAAGSPRDSKSRGMHPRLQKSIILTAMFLIGTALLYGYTRGVDPSEELLPPEPPFFQVSEDANSGRVILSQSETEPPISQDPRAVDPPPIIQPSETSANTEAPRVRVEVVLFRVDANCGGEDGGTGWFQEFPSPTECMKTLRTKEECNQRFFAFSETDFNCRCIDPKTNCNNEEEMFDHSKVNVWEIVTRTLRVLPSRSVEMHRYYPGENTRSSILEMFRHPYTPHKVHIYQTAFCMVSTEFKVVYLKTPKAGSSLFHWFTGDAMKADRYLCYNRHDGKGMWYKETGKSSEPAISLKDYVVFTTVREPFERLVSGFQETSLRLSHGTIHDLSPRENANFSPLADNFTTFINQLYEEDYSKIYDEHVGSSVMRFATMRDDLDWVIRLENALADWRELQEMHPHLPDINDYVSKKARSRFGKRMLGSLSEEEAQKSCWVMRKSYCALPYRLPDRCENLFTCVELRHGNATVFIPEPDLDDHMHDLFHEMTDPLHLDFKPKKKEEVAVHSRYHMKKGAIDDDDYDEYVEKESPVKKKAKAEAEASAKVEKPDVTNDSEKETEEIAEASSQDVKTKSKKTKTKVKKKGSQSFKKKKLVKKSSKKITTGMM